MTSGAAGRRKRVLKTIGATRHLDGCKNKRGGITRTDQRKYGKVYRRWRLHYGQKQLYFSAAEYGTVAEARKAAEKIVRIAAHSAYSEWLGAKGVHDAYM